MNITKKIMLLTALCLFQVQCQASDIERLIRQQQTDNAILHKANMHIIKAKNTFFEKSLTHKVLPAALLSGFLVAGISYVYSAGTNNEFIAKTRSRFNAAKSAKASLESRLPAPTATEEQITKYNNDLSNAENTLKNTEALLHEIELAHGDKDEITAIRTREAKQSLPGVYIATTFLTGFCGAILAVITADNKFSKVYDIESAKAYLAKNKVA